MLGASAVISDADAMARYCRDWSGDLTGRPLAAVRPADTGAVGAVMALCREHSVAQWTWQIILWQPPNSFTL